MTRTPPSDAGHHRSSRMVNNEVKQMNNSPWADTMISGKGSNVSSIAKTWSVFRPLLSCIRLPSRIALHIQRMRLSLSSKEASSWCSYCTNVQIAEQVELPFRSSAHDWQRYPGSSASNPPSSVCCRCISFSLLPLTGPPFACKYGMADAV